MFHGGLKASRSRVRSLIAFFAAILCTSIAAADTTDALVSWAEKTTPMAWQAGSLTTASTMVADHFGSIPYEAWSKRGQNGLGYPGVDLPTAGAGSSWVYDSVHRIAAGTAYNDDGGWDDLIAYAAAPPSKIPGRNLSGVVSVRGLKLGMSPSQAASDFGVSASAAKRLDAHTSALSVLKNCPKPQRCAHFGVVVFRDGHAVYITLGLYGGM